MTIHLQGIGEVPAVYARDIKPGMIFRWNYDHRSTVLSVTHSASGKTVTVVTLAENGKTYTRRLSWNTAVGIA